MFSNKYSSLQNNRRTLAISLWRACGEVVAEGPIPLRLKIDSSHLTVIIIKLSGALNNRAIYTLHKIWSHCLTNSYWNMSKLVAQLVSSSSLGASFKQILCRPKILGLLLITSQFISRSWSFPIIPTESAKCVTIPSLCRCTIYLELY